MVIIISIMAVTVMNRTSWWSVSPILRAFSWFFHVIFSFFSWRLSRGDWRWSWFTTTSIALTTTAGVFPLLWLLILWTHCHFTRWFVTMLIEAIIYWWDKWLLLIWTTTKCLWKIFIYTKLWLHKSWRWYSWEGMGWTAGRKVSLSVIWRRTAWFLSRLVDCAEVGWVLGYWRHMLRMFIASQIWLWFCPSISHAFIVFIDIVFKNFLHVKN